MSSKKAKAQKPPFFLTAFFRALISRNLTDAQFASALALPLLVFAVAIVIFPLAYSFWVSLRDVSILIGIDKFVGADQYIKALRDPQVQNSMVVTFHFLVEVVPLTVLLGFGFALVLNETFRGRGIVRVLMLVPWGLSEYVTAVIWRDIYNPDYGLINGLLYQFGFIKEYLNFFTQESVIECVSIAFAWHVVPIMAFFLLGGLQSVPEDLYSQAKIDAIGPIRRFTSITFPYVRYAFLVGLIFITFMAATATDIFIVLTAGGPGNSSTALTYQIYKTAFLLADLGYGSAISFILLALTIPILLVYFQILTRRT